MLTIGLWLVGFYLRPDYWALLPNSFAILLNYTEVALIAVGLITISGVRPFQRFFAWTT